MMKRIAAACLLLLWMLGAAALADIPQKPTVYAYAYDFDGSVLSQGDMETITRCGKEVEEKTGAQVIAVVVDFLDGMEPADYATDLINTWGIGSKERNDGVVVLLARGDREIFIGTGSGIDDMMPGSACGELIDANIGYFADNQFAKGMTALYADVCSYILSGVDGAPARSESAGFSLKEWALFVLVLIACCAALIGYLIHRDKRKMQAELAAHGVVYDEKTGRYTRTGNGGADGSQARVSIVVNGVTVYEDGDFSGDDDDSHDDDETFSSGDDDRDNDDDDDSGFGGGSSDGGGAGRSF